MLYAQYRYCTFQCTFSALSMASSGTSEINQSLNEHTKVYRGACTVKDWSNSIACLNEIYPEGKSLSVSRHRVLASVLQTRHVHSTGVESVLIISATVDLNNAIWIWKCPPENTNGASGPYRW